MGRVLMMTLLGVCYGAAAAASDKEVVVTWSDLTTYVSGKKFSTVLKDGSRIQGRAISVEAEALSVMISRSSNRAFAKGKVSLPRASLASIRVQSTGWKWKVIGPVVGCAAMGALGGGVGIASGGLEGAGVGTLAGMGIGAAIGAVGGRSADHHNVTIKIAP